jgi:hypothetical protein
LLATLFVAVSIWFLQAPAYAAAIPNYCGACQGSGPIGQLESMIMSIGHPVLCQISDINPSDQGGASTVEILSYTDTKRCNPASTANQGVLYLVQTESAADARYLLDLADVTPPFHDGWQRRNVAVLLTNDTSVLHQLEVYRALKGHARLAFTHAY